MRMSQRYADHSAELLTTQDYIMGDDGTPTAAATRLGITAEEVNSISALRIAYETVYVKYTNPNMHNAIIVHDMKVADDTALTTILPLRQRLKNGTATLTPEDYANLGIHEDKTTRTPSEIPKEVPMAVLVESKLLHLQFESAEQTTEGFNRVALPKSYRIAREVAVVAQGIEPTEGDFHSIGNVGRSRFTIAFTSAEIGMSVYVRIAYETTAGLGAFSPAVKAIII